MSFRASQNKLPGWARWILIAILVLMVGWLLWVGVGFAVLYFGIKPNCKKLYESTFANPSTDVQGLRSGGVSFQGWDVWLTFRSENDIQLKDEESFTVLYAKQALDKLAEASELPCQQLIDASEEQNLEFLYKTDPSVGVPNGQFLVHDKLNHHYCYQDWYHK